MNQTAGATLKGIIASHGHELINEPKRCENVLEVLPQGARQEKNALITTLKERVPQRLVVMPAGTLTAAAIRNYAAEVSDATGLKEDIARWAVETWAFALDLKVQGEDNGEDEKNNTREHPLEKDPPERKRLIYRAALARMSAMSDSLRSGRNTLIGILISVIGLLLMVISGVALTLLLIHNWGHSHQIAEHMFDSPENFGRAFSPLFYFFILRFGWYLLKRGDSIAEH